MRILCFILLCFIWLACGDTNRSGDNPEMPSAQSVETASQPNLPDTANHSIPPAIAQQVQETESEQKAAPTVETKPSAAPKKVPPAEPIKPAPPKNEAVSSTNSQPPNDAPNPVIAPKKVVTEQKIEVELDLQQPPTHTAWDQLLRQYVDANGKVNYKGLKNDKPRLEAYLETLKNNPPQESWKRNEKMAYWINAYNAFTVKLIVDNYPLASITKLDGGKPWDKKWIKIGGKAYSLNNIEHDILQPQFKEPRIHFAVNCAAKSCPPLLNQAWTAENLEANFEKQTRSFINNPSYNTIAAKSVKVSKIFEWYAADFGNLIDFLNRYASTKINGNAKVSYVEYDWTLNE